MIESASEVAFRLWRTARAKRLAERYWAGWRLVLTYGPYDEALPARDVAQAKAVVREVFGPERVAAETTAAAVEAQRDLWHLSASWRGVYPAADGRVAIDELIVALGVPADKRAGRQPARVFDPAGRPSPQVTHWIWRDA